MRERYAKEMFRRKAPNPTLEAFLRMAEKLDQAQRGLLGAIPTSRDPGVPTLAALDAFDRHLIEATELMPAWHADDTRSMHARCTEAIEHAQRESALLRAQAGTLSFETLNVRVGDILHPLEEFADTERALRKRR